MGERGGALSVVCEEEEGGRGTLKRMYSRGGAARNPLLINFCSRRAKGQAGRADGAQDERLAAAMLSGLLLTRLAPDPAHAAFMAAAGIDGNSDFHIDEFYGCPEPPCPGGWDFPASKYSPASSFAFGDMVSAHACAATLARQAPPQPLARVCTDVSMCAAGG